MNNYLICNVHINIINIFIIIKYYIIKYIILIKYYITNNVLRYYYLLIK